MIGFIAQQVGRRLLLKPAHEEEFLSRLSRRETPGPSWKVPRVRAHGHDDLTRKQTPSNFKGAPIIREYTRLCVECRRGSSTVYPVYTVPEHRRVRHRAYDFITNLWPVASDDEKKDGRETKRGGGKSFGI